MTTGKALIFGGQTGLLGQAVNEILLAAGWETLSLASQDLDLLDFNATSDYLRKQSPDAVFNCTAYTMVDQAEDESGQAYRINEAIPKNIGKAVSAFEIPLVHFSTDFVFNGKSKRPYTEKDQTDPLSIYGKSKLAGEQALLSLYPSNTIIIRTAWLFGPHKTNFLSKIMEIASQKPQLGIVHDQIGSPTYTPDLALASLKLLQKNIAGIYHFANSGQASWCEFAAEGVRCAGIHCSVQPITSADYPQKAVRPAYSALDCSKFKETTGITPRPWAQAVRDYLYRIGHP